MALNLNEGLTSNNLQPLFPNGKSYDSILGYRNPGHPKPVKSVSPVPVQKTVSGLKKTQDSLGNSYDYVVVNNEYARITKIITTQKSLEIPGFLDSWPVLSLGSEVLAENDIIENLVCASSIGEIGACAFRFDYRLKSVVFPANLSSYSPSWLSHDEKLERLVLPGSLKKLSRAIFDHPSLKYLSIGAQVETVEAGASEKTTLESFDLDSENPYLATDGVGLYTKDFSEFLALLKPVKTYALDSRCKIVGRKAAKGHLSLEAIELPEGLKEVKPFAFAHTGLTAVSIPSSVETLGERCFFHTEFLTTVNLCEGLVTLEDGVFAESALEALAIPATVQSLGNGITENTAIVYRGPKTSFSISKDSPYLLDDGFGGVYRKGDDGLHFILLADRTTKTYDLMEGVKVIDPYAMAFNEVIEEVTIPDGVTTICDNAFRICRSLRKLRIPDSVETIGKEAFLDTSLESFRVPKDLKTLGSDALVTNGAHHSAAAHSLGSITVAEGNENFYMASGILCRKGKDGDTALMFTDSISSVVIPDTVTTVASYAFYNAEAIESLRIPPSLRIIGHNGFVTWSIITTLDITVGEPLEGRTHFVLHFPNLERVRHDMAIAIGGSTWVNVPEIYRLYDNCLVNSHDYSNGDGISPHEQATKILGRLEDSIFLLEVNRSMFVRTLELNFSAICKDIGRHDDRGLFQKMAAMGFLNSDNIEQAILAVQPLQDASITGYLLELKRLHFGLTSYDFEL